MYPILILATRISRFRAQGYKVFLQFRQHRTFVRSRYVLNQNSNKLLLNHSPKLKPGCYFHTTPKRYNPIISTIVRQVFKVVSIIAGRTLRKWYQNLSNEKKKSLSSWLFLNRSKLIFVLVFAMLGLTVYYYTHIQETPITKRKRFIAFSPDQFELLNTLELESQLKTYQNKLLPSNHSSTQRVARVARKLLESNKDIDHIKNHEWSVSVINDEETMNAFVLPSGNIFVFSGLLKICENDDQLATVLSHEMSHAILCHGMELLSHAHMVDLFFIGIIGFLWMLLPTDSIASIGTAISRFLMRITLDNPYSKLLETEADECFWDKMTKVDKDNGPEFTKIDFLTTHPSHEKRCENLDSLLEGALKCRSEHGCGPLPKQDPRERVKNQQFVKKAKDKEGIVVL
ncbi:hypothetical protein RDWZM_005786 [Blomia tropicalis]|uniref:Metalloendopeptidase OMA1, mitochondrial n=1 Tax=Blomia tropicalis TaxID=40697 RepID=A0A9Q0M6W5_BLOTA|nr:hypothetical protein RDWZM_005786 [Blomia tropicalis]